MTTCWMTGLVVIIHFDSEVFTRGRRGIRLAWRRPFARRGLGLYTLSEAQEDLSTREPSRVAVDEKPKMMDAAWLQR